MLGAIWSNTTAIHATLTIMIEVNLLSRSNRAHNLDIPQLTRAENLFRHRWWFCNQRLYASRGLEETILHLTPFRLQVHQLEISFSKLAIDKYMFNVPCVRMKHHCRYSIPPGQLVWRVPIEDYDI